MRVLVTGGGGFIASWIVKQLLDDGVAVRSLDLTDKPAIAQTILGDLTEQVEWRAGDIASAEDVDAAGQRVGPDVYVILGVNNNRRFARGD